MERAYEGAVSSDFAQYGQLWGEIVKPTMSGEGELKGFTLSPELTQLIWFKSGFNVQVIKSLVKTVTVLNRTLN